MATVSTTDFGAALTAAIHGGYVAHLTGQTYTITSPIVIHVTSTIQGALGVDGGGATLVSQVRDGSPLIQIVVDPGVDFRYLTLSNFNIQGNGREGDGIELIADGNDRWAYNWLVDNVAVTGVGGYGLSVEGSTFEGLVYDSWMNNNALGGAYFAHSANGGVASALRWVDGGFQDNGGSGITLGQGARDMGVDGALFANNGGPGISALTGITSVTASRFENNGGAGIAFQNYGNFDGNVFVNTAVQTVGISGYLAGQATLVENTATGGTLANVQGEGGLFATDNSGRIVSGPSLAANDQGGNLTRAAVGTQGVTLPALAAVTAATTAAVSDSAGTGTLESTLRAALTGATVLRRTDDVYSVTTSIVINVTRSSDGPVGIDLGGAKILSRIGNGSPVIEIHVASGVQLGSLTLSNFSILGNGREGDGIKIVADGADRSIHDWSISNVNIEHVGGIGLDVLGNVSNGTVFNSWMHGNEEGGARFAGSAGGGVPVGLQWVGGGMRKNGVAGLILDNGARDMTVSEAYFVDNDGPGIVATSGIEAVEASGFENNLGVGAVIRGPASFIGDTFATYGRQPVGIGGYLAGSRVTLTGVGSEYYGPGADPTVTANVQGQGTLAVAGGGNVLVGPNVAVIGALATIIEAAGSTRLLEASGHYLLQSTGGSSDVVLRQNGVPWGPNGGWQAIAAERTAGGYSLWWRNGSSDSYVQWSTDLAGNFISNGAFVTGVSYALESTEPAFAQDLNGDGTIGLASSDVEIAGNTKLAQVADFYFLYQGDGSSGVVLRQNGVPWGPNGGWQAIAAERTAGGYSLWWRSGSSDSYVQWSTDLAGNFVSNGAFVGRRSYALESTEPAFAQDLNGDGTIGIASLDVETAGNTKLAQVADFYFLYQGDGSSGVVLRQNGVPWGPNGGWQAIAAERTVGGYSLWWRNGSSDSYVQWSTDLAGNFVSNGAFVGRRSYALELTEPAFAQDLNGDGTIGLASSDVEIAGNTKLAQVADFYFLYQGDGSSGVVLRQNGVPWGPNGGWQAIAAERTAGGYSLWWRSGSSDSYVQWSTDLAGNFVSNGAFVTGGSFALQATEPAFAQDLNGDGTIGVAGRAALLVNAMASTFVSPAVESPGAVAAAQPGPDFLAKPVA